MVGALPTPPARTQKEEQQISVGTPTRPKAGRPRRSPGKVARTVAALLEITGSALQRIAMRYSEGKPVMGAAFTFTLEVEPDELDGGFIISCRELPGCMSQGETIEEAIDNIRDAIGAVLETRLEDKLRSPNIRVELVREHTSVVEVTG